jgi:GT2 family glycosyltransferase
VRPNRQLELAEMLREHRERLASIASELAERGEPISELEARLLIEDDDFRLSAVEAALRQDARRRSILVGNAEGKSRLSRVGPRLRSWTKPRIGVLRHYEPKPMLLPAGYLEVQPPVPAPTISIVTPSYQQGRYIDRALYSVVNQKYPSLEYVVQDGGSSDETIDVLRRFEPLLSSWVSEPDDGQGDAVNRGFRKTTGEIMAWLNSDDLLLPGSLAYVASYFAKHPEVDVLYGHRIMIDQTDSQIGAWVLPAHDDGVLTLADYVPQETLFWRRSIWEATGGYVDGSFGYALDWDLLLRFREAGAKMVRVPRFLGAFRIHEEQKTTALHAVGESETDQLRLRVHERAVPIDEVLRRLRPYFLRHIVVHTRQRIVDRLPLRRVQVATTPAEPWLRTPASERALPAGRALHHEPTVLISPFTPEVPGVGLPLEQVLPDERDPVPATVGESGTSPPGGSAEQHARDGSGLDGNR